MKARPLIRQGDLKDRCPRLWMAIQQRRALEAALPAARARAYAEVVDAERLVAHRDLQLIRSFARTSKRGKEWAKYLRERRTKLKQAEAYRDRCLARVPQTWEDIAA